MKKTSKYNKYIILTVLVISVLLCITIFPKKRDNSMKLAGVRATNESCSLIPPEEFKDMKVYWNNKIIPGFFTVYYDGYNYSISFVSSFTDTFRFGFKHSKEDNVFTLTNMSADWVDYVIGNLIKTNQPLELPNFGNIGDRFEFIDGVFKSKNKPSLQLFVPSRCTPQISTTGNVRFEADYNLSTTESDTNTLTYCLNSIISSVFNTNNLSRVTSEGKGFTSAKCITEWRDWNPTTKTWSDSGMVKTLEPAYSENQKWTFEKWDATASKFIKSTDIVKYGDNIRIKTSTLSRNSNCKNKYLTGGRGIRACDFVILDDVDKAISYFTVKSPLGDFTGQPVGLGEPIKLIFNNGEHTLYGSMPTSTSININGNINTFDGNYDVYTWFDDRWFSPEHTWVVKTAQ